MPCPASARPIDCCGSLLPAFANSDAVAVLPFIIAGRGDEAASSLERFAEERLRRYGPTRALKVDSRIKDPSSLLHDRSGSKAERPAASLFLRITTERWGNRPAACG